MRSKIGKASWEDAFPEKIKVPGWSTTYSPAEGDELPPGWGKSPGWR